MKVLLTGGDGFVGREFQRQLRGADITIVDIKSGPDFRDWCKWHTDRFDLVIHLAAIVGGRLTIERSPLQVATDLAIDADMFNWCVATGQERLVYFSSSAAYPIRLQQRDDWRLLREDHIDLREIGEPDMTYGWAKLTGEYLAQHARAAGVATYVFRPFSGYGTDQDLDYPFPSFIRRAAQRKDPFEVWGDGTQVRDFIHIRDVVSAVLSVVEHDYREPVNLCTGIGTDFNQLAHLAMLEMDYVGEIRHHGGMPVGCHHRVGDPTVMNRFWQPEIDVCEGIRMALAGIC